MEPLASIHVEMTYEDVTLEAKKLFLTVLGGFHPSKGDMIEEKHQTILILGPDEPEFWLAFKKSNEFSEHLKDPLDLWSKRIVNALAHEVNAEALFPFNGPPYAPFYSWSLRTQRIYQSPIKLLVHDKSGLFVSFRGALGFSEYIALPPIKGHPCKNCDAPCSTACPVDAFAGGTYDVATCKSHITSADRKKCLSNGCAARHACPISQNSGRLKEQSAFHMKAFVT